MLSCASSDRHNNLLIDICRHAIWRPVVGLVIFLEKEAIVYFLGVFALVLRDVVCVCARDDKTTDSQGTG